MTEPGTLEYWRNAYWDLWRSKNTEIRLDSQNKLDEIVGNGGFHLEQMSKKLWFLDLGGTAMFFKTKRIRPRDYDSWQDAAVQTNQKDGE